MTHYPEGSRVALRIESAFPKPGWRARAPGAHHRVDSPGTPVLFEGRFLEVVEYSVKSGGLKHLYLLAEWDDREPFRAPQEYSAEIAREHAKQHSEAVRRSILAWVLTLLSPLVALVPASWQKRLESRCQFPAVLATAISAALVLGLMTIAAVLKLASGLGGAPSPLAVIPGLYIVYFLLESLVRLGSALRAGEPMGSAPVALPALLVEHMLFREREPPRPRVPQRELLDAVDEVRRVEHEGRASVEVVSLLPKTWAIGRTGVRMHQERGDELLMPVEHEVLSGASTRYLYRLEPLEQNAVPGSWVNYEPGETGHLYRDALRTEYQVWVDSFSVLWGNLEPQLQSDLERIYGFDPRRSTRRAVACNLVFALVLLWVAGGYLLSGAGGLGDLLVLGFAVYLGLESNARRLQLRRGELSGSVVGRALRWLALRFVGVGSADR